MELSAAGADLVLQGTNKGEENKWTAGQKKETRDKLDHGRSVQRQETDISKRNFQMTARKR